MRIDTHTHVYIGDYIECLVVGWVPRKRKREGAKKRVEGWLSTISSNQAKANYKFNSELCTGDN